MHRCFQQHPDTAAVVMPAADFVRPEVFVPQKQQANRNPLILVVAGLVGFLTAAGSLALLW
jgi:hypothetical protein